MQCDLNAINRAYACAADVQISDIPIDFLDLAALIESVNHLELATHKIESQLLDVVVEHAKRMCWDFVTNIISFQAIIDYQKSGFSMFRDNLESLCKYVPELQHTSELVLTRLDALQRRQTNPLFDNLRDEIITAPPTIRRRCVVLLGAKYIGQTRQLLLQTSGCDEPVVITTFGLRNLDFYDQIILVGPPAMFERSGWITGSPRAPLITTLRYKWLNPIAERPDPFLQNGVRVFTQSARTSAIPIVVGGSLDALT
jgi:hypothetical protein